ncbi:MAG: hypothetical protein HZB80_04995 [Deltaproteobacteria bacterium]|nr:hypothetical protein [Deltaproteobacteria bacterium]
MSFKDILGHDREISILKKAISNNRVAHSFLFAGHEGIGKRLVAISVAKALNCSAANKSPSLSPFNKTGCDGSNNDFCGVCQNCKDIEASSYSDVFLIEPREPESKGGKIDHIAGTIKIDAVRDVQQRLSYRAARGGKKVCIVDCAEKMNKEAQNAFLKTLEEPPSDSIIILVVSDGGAILPTITSRCQRINFTPLPQNVMLDIVGERLGAAKETAVLLACLSGGSIGKALNLDMDTMLEQRKKIVEVLSRLSLDDAEGMFKAAEKISKGERPVESLEFLKIWYRDIAILKEGVEDMVVNSDLLPVLRQHMERQTFSRLISDFQMVLNAQSDIMPPRYANKQLTIENLLMQLAT